MISICIPTYEMAGNGIKFLAELLDSIWMQTYDDYEIVISDNSHDDWIEKCIHSLDPVRAAKIVYLRNPGNHSTQNLNNAVRNARGNIIKPLFQDDKFIHKTTLENIALMFDSADIKWCVLYSHNEGIINWDFEPLQYETDRLLLEGKNYYGSPSAIAYLRCDEYFDENLIWLMDCEFYCRLHKRYGDPYLIADPMFIRQWPGQMTNTIAVGNVRILEQNYCLEKHENK